MGLRSGCGVAGPCLLSVKAFIRAAISGFMVGGFPLANVAPAGLRAASSWPRAVEEAVMLAMLDGTLVSDCIRCTVGEVTRVGSGLASGELSSSGEVGGEGELSGDSGSDDMVNVVGWLRSPRGSR